MNLISFLWFFYAILAFGGADNHNVKFKVIIPWILLVLSSHSSIQKVKLRNYDTLLLNGTRMPINSRQGGNTQDFLEHMCCMICANLVRCKSVDELTACPETVLFAYRVLLSARHSCKLWLIFESGGKFDIS